VTAGDKDQLFSVKWRNQMSRSNFEASFKDAQGGGFVFRPPNPWIFGSVQNYIANEEQKAEILELGTVRRPVVRTVAFMLALIGCPAASIIAVYLLSDKAGPGLLEAAAITILILGSYALLWLIAIRSQLRRLRPVLARLVPTDEEFTAQEVQALQAKRTSAKTSTILGLVFAGSVIVQALSMAFGAGFDLGAHRTLHFEMMPLLLMFLQGAFAWKFLSQAITKMRASGAS
jgi:hypothetical protein